MTYALEHEVRAYLAGLRFSAPETKDESRALMARRRLEILTQHRRSLAAMERRAVRLVQRVDYADIRPRLVYVSPADKPLWAYYRHILSSAPFTAHPGRSCLAFCVDEVSGGILGIAQFGSELMLLGPRDKHVGWTREQRHKWRRLNAMAAVNTCVSVQPFGWLCGGKYIIRELLSRFTVDIWKRAYGDDLAAIGTTSLYGRSSQYERIPGFEFIGETAGVGIFHIDEHGFDILKAFISANNFAKGRSTVRRTPIMGRLEALLLICGKLGIDSATVGCKQTRGVYFGAVSDNALPYLRCEQDAPTYAETPPAGVAAAWWHDRWYTMRLPKKAADIAAFDLSAAYTVQAQMQACRRLVAAESARVAGVDSDAPGSPPGEDGASPSPRSIPAEVTS